MTPDVNDLAFWFPPIAERGLVPVPETYITHAEGLETMLDGVEPDCDWEGFMRTLEGFAVKVGEPFFLRTGHTSGKHDWRETCYVESAALLSEHVYRLVEFSHLVDLMGLPHSTWAVRKLIETEPICICRWYGHMPVNREFRVFIRGDEVEDVYPYWPELAVERGGPDRERWREALAEASVLDDETTTEICTLAGMAAGALAVATGDERMFWSMDFLQDKDGKWWLTDAADGARSYRPGDE